MADKKPTGVKVTIPGLMITELVQADSTWAVVIRRGLICLAVLAAMKLLSLFV